MSLWLTVAAVVALIGVAAYLHHSGARGSARGRIIVLCLVGFAAIFLVGSILSGRFLAVSADPAEVEGCGAQRVC